jgi:hypothetical protein
MRTILVLPVTAHPLVKAPPCGQGTLSPTLQLILDIFALERVEVIDIKQRFSDAVVKYQYSIAR